MSRNTSISLGNYFEQFIEEEVANGGLNNASEVIRAGLRLQEEEAKIVALKKAIAEGYASGVAQNFDPNAHLEKQKTARRKHGLLCIE